MLVLDLHSILALVLLLDLLEAEDDLVGSSGPALAPGLGGQVFRALRGSKEGLRIQETPRPSPSYLEPCDLGDGVTQNVEDKECIVSLCGGHLVCWLHVFWFFSLGSQGSRGFVPVLERNSYQRTNKVD